MEHNIVTVKELPDIAFLYYDAKSWHSTFRVYTSYIFTSFVNLVLIAVYISAGIWIVRGLT